MEDLRSRDKDDEVVNFFMWDRGYQGGYFGWFMRENDIHGNPVDVSGEDVLEEARRFSHGHRFMSEEDVIRDITRGWTDIKRWVYGLPQTRDDPVV